MALALLRTHSALRSGALTGLAQLGPPLAALNSYGTAAAGFALGGLSGLATFAALADSVGIVALAWGLVVNACVAITIPVLALLRKRALAGAWPANLDVLPRLWHLLEGA